MDQELSYKGEWEEEYVFVYFLRSPSSCKISTLNSRYFKKKREFKVRITRDTNISFEVETAIRNKNMTRL